MWKLVKISQQTYFICCDFNSHKQDVTFILHDLKETWCQTLTIIEVKQKVKLLNKRLDFSEDNIKEAFTTDSLQSAVIEESSNTSTVASNCENCLLKLKYRVKDRILTYEWNLKKQTADKFQQTFFQPLLKALMGCQEQIAILSETVRKKDVELKQYRIEGAVLNRKTVATKPFDFDDFTINYKECNETAANFKELANYIKENVEEVPDIPNRTLNINKLEVNSKSEENLKESNNTNTKLSPRQQKRKIKEIKMQHLQDHLKRRKQGLEYESSQSQTTSTGNSQDTDENDKKDKTNSTKEFTTTNTSSTRKNTRCMPPKQQSEYVSSEDKTDSENEGNLKKPKDHKSADKITNQDQKSRTSSTKPDNSKITENTKQERTIRNCVKSLSYKSPIQSLEKCSESSDVFDFSTYPEDNDKTIKEKLKQKRNKLSLNKTKDMKSSPDKDGQEILDLDDVPLLERKKLTQIKRCSPKDKIGNYTSDHNKQLNNSQKSKVIHQISETDDDIIVMEGPNTNNLNNCIKFNSIISLRTPSPKIKTLSHSPTPAIIDDLSSQLNNIKKELESLEALRLADLKQRMCKAI
ncbi:uncharacterized protein ACRADG_008014 [Cochliomyia hominivorax]